ncbi:MAG: hypothetical protein JST55_09940 [Bacteroidetes bacterium]|nr:hypothetical protein [Bacteroidota bacterium]
MAKNIELLLDQKHLLNQIDLFIYSTFLDEKEINSLLKIYKSKEAGLENLLNKLQKNSKKLHRNLFLEYFSTRKKIHDEEQNYFAKISEEITLSQDGQLKDMTELA